MRVELVTIGTELLLGFTVDSNSAHLGRVLAGAGVRVVRRATVADAPDAIRDAVGEALARTGAVIVTGGLGPTRDDVSKKAVAELFGWPLRFDDQVWGDLTARFRRLGREPSPANRCQAEVPEGAIVLANRWGTAPGLWFEGPPGLVVMLPGVPREMRKLLEHEVMPRLASRGGGRVIRSTVVRTTGIPESTLGARVEPVEEELQPLTLAYLPGTDGVDLRLTAWDLPPVDADRLLAAGAARLRAIAGDHAYGRDDDDLAALVLARCRERGWRLAVAESCTGGMLGTRLTAIAGSSDVFAGGVIGYANEAKAALLGVPGALIAAHGAVSEEVALAMAEGAAASLGTEAAAAITGIAGPSGGSPDKPVGTVCFGWVAGNLRETARVVFPGNRGEIRERAVQFALHRLWQRA
ncbi:MAG TPA: competence/damage-inducible protein A [Gemmatimonadales bacterium]|nr:competence/damage-inducible protein A [Gemmatimonadales bacterium]